jgi:cytochrome bd-type quinol oxidase subunit 2
MSYPPENFVARAAVVNRTHRVVREQATTMRAQRERSRSLWVPLGICSLLLMVLCYSLWYMLDGYDATPSGIPDASDQLLLLLIWLVPVIIAAVAFIWFRREREQANEGAR